MISTVGTQKFWDFIFIGNNHQTPPIWVLRYQISCSEIYITLFS